MRPLRRLPQLPLFLPVVWQQLIDAAVGVRRNVGQRIGKPLLRIYIVQQAGAQ
ncbi:MAG: hypothetical protein OXI38_12705 [Bacteroidota bacterium]|nr:hypothetical protein [Bacteroidota bacterium]